MKHEPRSGAALWERNVSCAGIPIARPNGDTFGRSNWIIMTHTQLVRLLTAGVLACMSTAPVLGQSLADAAKRAEEERQERPKESRSFTNGDLTDVVSSNNREIVTLELAMPLLGRYYGVRTAIL